MTARHSTLTQKELKIVVHYSPTSGLFYKIPTTNRNPASRLIGTTTESGYRRIQINRERFMAHRLAWLYMTGAFPSEEIDHINHHRSDNRFINLREATRTENTRNATIRKDNRHGVPGIQYIERINSWEVTLGGCKNRLYDKTFKSFEDAVKARLFAEKHFGYHENHGAPKTSCSKRG